VNRDAM